MGASQKEAVATPPSGTYTSVPNSGNSTWQGSFTYDNSTKVIVYTVGNNNYTTQNNSNGNALEFTIPDGNPQGATRWILANPGSQNGKATYGGTIVTPGNLTGGQSGWTATQT